MFQASFESMNRKELKELQLQRLKTTLERIVGYNPFYAEKLNGLTAGDVKHLEDIQKFPFLTRKICASAIL